MRKLRGMAAAAIAIAWAIGGCTSQDSSTTASGEAVTQDDVVKIADLLVVEGDGAADGAAAGAVGKPATLLALAQQDDTAARNALAVVLNVVSDLAEGKAPTTTGDNTAQQPYALWTGSKAGVELKFWVVRTATDRLRYLMTGSKAGGPQKFLLTGVFLKKAPKVGGGRLHVSLTNASALFGAPGKTGSLHVWFANHKSDVKGRRIAFVNVSDPSKADMPVNVVGDALVRPGVGGQARTIAIGDWTDLLPGVEALAMRVRWKTGVGGRADALLASLATGQPKTLASLHECWGKDGVRTGYLATPADPNNPNEGAVDKCFELEQQEVPATAARRDGQDPDPELDALLLDSGAAAIDEAEADSQDGSI